MSETKDKSKIPNWLTDLYIGKIFSDFVSQERILNDPIDWQIEMQVFHKNFDNLATRLFKVKVTNKNEPKEVFNAMIKILSDSTPNYFNISLSSQAEMFKREGKLYKDFLQEVNKIIRTIDGCEKMFFPKLFHFSEDPLILVTEDMTPYGFKIYMEPYSLDDCHKVFENLGRFHALSYHVHHELKKDLSVYDNFIGKDLMKNIPIVMMAYQAFLEVVETWEDCSEFAEKLRKFEPYYCNKLVEQCLTTIGEFKVLNHGDSHKSNYLFRANKMDIVLIDYQMSAWRSPAYDIIGNFNTFCEPEDNINSRMILLKSYYREFRTILEKLKFSHKIPSLLDLHVEVLKSGIIDLMYWSIYNPLGRLNSSPEDLRDFNVRFREALDDSRQRKLAKCFQTFMDLGYLEYEEEDRNSL